MKAIICEKYNSIEHLKIKEVAIPKVGPNDVLIKIKASTVASGDSVVRTADNPFVRVTFV